MNPDKSGRGEPRGARHKSQAGSRKRKPCFRLATPVPRRFPPHPSPSSSFSFSFSYSFSFSSSVPPSSYSFSYSYSFSSSVPPSLVLVLVFVLVLRPSLLALRQLPHLRPSATRHPSCHFSPPQDMCLALNLRPESLYLPIICHSSLGTHLHRPPRPLLPGLPSPPPPRPPPPARF